MRTHAPCPRFSGGAAPNRRRPPVAARAARNPYDVLGVPHGAGPADVKKAYRRLALKLHPDVNKAPDATTKFMEARAAFRELTEAKPSSSGSSYSGFGGFGGGGRPSSSSSSTRRPPPPPDQPFYGFADFLRDLERDLGDRAHKRRSAGGSGSGGGGGSGGASSSSSGPRSLWEELSDLGAEFLDFLESEAGLPPVQPTDAAAAAEYAAAAQAAAEKMAADAATAAAAAAASAYTAGAAARAAADGAVRDAVNAGASARAAAEAAGRQAEAAGRQAQADADAAARVGARPAPSTPTPTPKAEDDDIEAMLRDMKKKLGL